MNTPKTVSRSHIPLKRGAKLKWVPTSFRFSPELHKFLKDEAAAANVDLVNLVTEVLEQFRAHRQVVKKGLKK